MYATLADFIARFGEPEAARLSSRAGTAAVVQDAIIDNALQIASAMVDGYCAARYALPLTVADAALKFHTLSIARYSLELFAHSDASQADYEAAMTYLKGIAAGRVVIGGAASNAVVLSSNGGAIVNAPTATMDGIWP